MLKVAVVALQGGVQRHVEALAAAGASPVEVRTPADLTGCDAVVLPGGESSTLSKLLLSSGLFDALAERLAAGMPAFGTCAGMILLADEILDGRADQRSFGAIDVSVRRNAFGRQLDSFEAPLRVAGLPGTGLPGVGVEGGEPFPAVFIRAPVVVRVGDGVEVLASVDGRAVLCRQGQVLVAAFHPELSDDLRLHQLFLNQI